MRLFIVFFICIFLTPVLLFSKTKDLPNFKWYQVNVVPFKKYPAQFEEYRKLEERRYDFNQPLAMKDYERRLELLLDINKKEPDWIDGYWMIASETFQLGSLVNDDGQGSLDYARKVFVTGRDKARECLQKSPDNFLCKLFLGSLIGKIATIDGVFSSLYHGSEVLDLWADVINSEYNFRFTKEITAQGSIRYGMGLFYRLVPDFFLVDWFFGIHGDIEKSIQFHRESIAIDGESPCANIMLAVSLLCESSASVDSENTKEGISILTKVVSTKTFDGIQQVCIDDAAEILKSPGDKSCGYTTARQQDLGEKKIIKSKRQDS